MSSPTLSTPKRSPIVFGSSGSRVATQPRSSATSATKAKRESTRSRAAGSMSPVMRLQCSEPMSVDRRGSSSGISVDLEMVRRVETYAVVRTTTPFDAQ